MGDTLIQFGFPLIIFVLLASGFGLPIPEDIPLLVTGYLCSFNPDHLWTMIPLTFAAVLGSDCCVYWMGRHFGHHVPRLPLLRRFLDEKHLARAQRAYHDHGGKTLFIARFLPGLRAASFFTAGAFKIPFWKLLVFDGSAALISVPSLVLLGFFFANQFDRVEELTNEAQALLALVIVGVITAVVVIRVLRRRKVASARP